MSKAQVNSRVDESTKEAVGRLEKLGGFDSQSDAARHALRAGLAKEGYLTSGVGITPARKIARHVSLMLFYVAAVLLALSASTPVSFVFPAIGVAAGSGMMKVIDWWVLPALEPAVSSRLPKLEVNKRGRA